MQLLAIVQSIQFKKKKVFCILSYIPWRKLKSQHDASRILLTAELPHIKITKLMRAEKLITTLYVVSSVAYDTSIPVKNFGQWLRLENPNFIINIKKKEKEKDEMRWDALIRISFLLWDVFLLGRVRAVALRIHKREDKVDRVQVHTGVKKYGLIIIFLLGRKMRNVFVHYKSKKHLLYRESSCLLACL